MKDTTVSMPTATMVSGFGQYHTNEADPEKPFKKLTPYVGISLEGIRAMVDTPQEVDKAQAQWVIPSTLPCRTFETQEKSGAYLMLWGDLDEDAKPIAEVQDVLECQVIGDADHEIYNSRSATAENPKARVLIPLNKPLCGADWLLCQEILNDQLEIGGLKPDRVNEGFAQLCYLPNKGKHYKTLSKRGDVFFDPLTTWAAKIEAKRQALAAKAAAIAAASAAAKANREARQAARVDGSRPELIAAFNAEFTPQDIMAQAGYDQRGDSFRHPGSASGSYSASVRMAKDGVYRVHSLSSGDPLFTGGGGVGAHDAFSAFQVLMHGGDRNAALKDAGDNWLKIGHESWNKVVQREHMRDEAKKAADKAASAEWPDMADPFEQYAVPSFPVEALPPVFATLCRELSAQSGFDVGGYAFALLVSVSSLIDQRKRFRAGPLSSPPQLWGGLVANSGGGKSPTLNAVLRSIRSINDTLVKESSKEQTKYHKALETATKEERHSLNKPLWRQLVANDTTVEGLASLLQDNPKGLLLAHDELTEFIGRMDAYSGNGSGKDRGVYLRAYDGGSIVINRALKGAMVIENFSVGIVTGIQPEKLGDLFRKSGGGSDGLYQRFLMYVMQPAGRVDYSAELNAFTEANANTLINALYNWDDFLGVSNVKICPEGLQMMQEYHQNARTVSQRTPGKRLAEHLDKFPGFLARVTFTLHYLECVSSGVLVDVVSVETLQRAMQIMRCMYHHSVAVYDDLDANSNEASKLVKTACEAILSKSWSTVQRGDLTRHATDWRGSDDRQAEGAIDCLIELGWLRDVTPPVPTGKRGRKSSGVFLVNPKAHERFKAHAQRISEARTTRFKAIQELAATR